MHARTCSFTEAVRLKKAHDELAVLTTMVVR